jgi:hypothetical protein
MKTKTRIVLALVACVAAAITVYATVSIDDAGNGFVGKGDVQTAFGWNNAQLQANSGHLYFSYSASVVTTQDTTWSCTNDRNDNVQDRARTTTTTTTTSNPNYGEARVKNQITGFNLTGGTANTTSTSSTTGNMLNSCPGGPWVFNNDTQVGDPVEDPNLSSRTLQVCVGAGGAYNAGECRSIALE